MVAAILPVRMESVVLRRRGKRVIGPVDLTLGPGGITIIMGPNGAGKTSLLRALHGIERLSEGRVVWSAPQAHRHQALVFQNAALLRRSVLDNIAFPLRLDGVPRRTARETATVLAAEAGLGDMLDRDAALLSGGERQKLAIARARIRNPQLLLLDEPCTSLDPRSTAEIEAMLLAARNAGVRIVMSTHLIGQARRLADEIVFVYEGRVVETARAVDFLAGPANMAARAYLEGELYP